MYSFNEYISNRHRRLMYVKSRRFKAELEKALDFKELSFSLEKGELV